MVVPADNPSTPDTKADLLVQGQLGLQGEFQVSQDYIGRPCRKKIVHKK